MRKMMSMKEKKLQKFLITNSTFPADSISQIVMNESEENDVV